MGLISRGSVPHIYFYSSSRDYVIIRSEASSASTDGRNRSFARSVYVTHEFRANKIETALKLNHEWKGQV